jgi:hypothetical protein
LSSDPRNAPEGESGMGDRESELRAKNRRFLIVITSICFLLAAVGYLFARWLAGQPKIVH